MVSECRLKGNGHIPSSKRMSNVKMSPITLRDIPGYFPSNEEKTNNKRGY